MRFEAMWILGSLDIKLDAISAIIVVDTENWNTLSSVTQDNGLQYGLRQKTVLKRLQDGYLVR